MTPISFLRSIGKLIRGGAGTPQIMMGSIMGLMLGMTIDFSLLTVLLIAAMFAFNANKPVAGIATILGKALVMIFPWFFVHVGHAVIHSLGLESFWAWVFDAPVLALLNLHIYAHMGGFWIALVLGTAGGFAISAAVRKARKAIIAAHEASGAVRAVSGNKLSRLMARIVFGKQKKSLEEMLNSHPAVLRTGRIVAVAIIVVPLVVVDLFVTGPVLRPRLEEAISKAVGAQTDIESATLSVLRGKLVIAGLAVTNPEKPTHNLFQARRLSAGVSISDLLARRIVISDIQALDAQSDAPRATPGKVYPQPLPPPELPGEHEVFDYFEKGLEYRKYADHIRKATDWLGQREQEKKQQQAQAGGDGPASAAPVPQQAPEAGWASLAADSLLKAHPTWTIRRMMVSGISRQGSDEKYTLEGSEVSSHPNRNDRPMMLRLTSDNDLLIETVLDFTSAEAAHKLKIAVASIDPKGMLGDKSSVKVDQGTASLSIDGTFGSDEIRLPVEIRGRDLQISSKSGGVLGMDAARSKQVLDAARNPVIAVRLEGYPYRPRLIIDEQAMLASLVEAAKVGAVDATKRIAGEQLRNVLGGSSDKGEKPAPAPSPGGLLDALRK